MTTDSSRLSIREKLGYGLGDTASHFVWDMVGFWILIFYTDTFGISAAAAGTIMFIARLWDMASDPLMGVISDRTRSRWGKFRPYILWSALPYSACWRISMPVALSDRSTTTRPSPFLPRMKSTLSTRWR